MSTRLRRRLIALLVLVLVVGLAFVVFDERIMPKLVRGVASRGDGVFQVKPYLQLGDNPTLAEGSRLERAVVLWQTADDAGDSSAWSVAVQANDEASWQLTEPPRARRVAVEGVAPFRLYRAVLTGLVPGGPFAYRVHRGGLVVFEAKGKARKAAGQPQRFVVFGDGGADTWGQSAVAYQTYLARPDYVVVTGDVVYMRGRASEYLDHFFPIYNSDRAGRLWGAPLLRSTPFLTAAGNHDLIERDLDKHPDGLAYFYYWDQPRNGPEGRPGASGFPHLLGSNARRKAFLDASGPAYPRMANYSFDYGDVHWTVLDTNTYADWTDPALLAWLDADLVAARGRRWRIVAFHHPAFSSSKAHREDQRMRVLARTFERRGVAIVFNGHVHNYQRTRPLRFKPTTPAAGPTYGPFGQVEGTLTLDTAYDGKVHTQADGVIYVVTGAGGARLYNAEQTDDPASWQPYTARFVSNMHSLTVVDVRADALTVRQLSAEGAEIDKFLVSQPVSGPTP